MQELQVSSLNSTVHDLKVLLYNTLVESGKISSDFGIDRVRIRERHGNKLGRVVRSSMSWKQLILFSNKEFSAEVQRNI